MLWRFHMMVLCELKQWRVWTKVGFIPCEFSCLWPQISKRNGSVHLSPVLLLLRDAANDATPLPPEKHPWHLKQATEYVNPCGSGSFRCMKPSEQLRGISHSVTFW